MVMLQNHRTGLLWKMFMKNPEIQPALDAIGFVKDLSATDDDGFSHVVHVSPNPASGSFDILFDHQDLLPQLIELTDINGHVLSKLTTGIGQINRVDVTSLSYKGIIFVKMLYKNQMIVKKVLVY